MVLVLILQCSDVLSPQYFRMKIIPYRFSGRPIFGIILASFSNADQFLITADHLNPRPSAPPPPEHTRHNVVPLYRFHSLFNWRTRGQQFFFPRDKRSRIHIPGFYPSSLLFCVAITCFGFQNSLLAATCVYDCLIDQLWGPGSELLIKVHLLLRCYINKCVIIQRLFYFTFKVILFATFFFNSVATLKLVFTICNSRHFPILE